jgi:HTH-type transcriptional regulator/antitoxin HigA
MDSIQTETEYEMAMAEAARLWDAMEGSPEIGRLDALVKLIETYEEKAFPIDFPRPVDTSPCR